MGNVFQDVYFDMAKSSFEFFSLLGGFPPSFPRQESFPRHALPAGLLHFSFWIAIWLGRVQRYYPPNFIQIGGKLSPPEKIQEYGSNGNTTLFPSQGKIKH